MRGLLRFEHRLTRRKGVSSSRFLWSEKCYAACENTYLQPVTQQRRDGKYRDHSLRETGRKNNKYYVFYDESEAAGLAGTKTTIKWDYERVIILRSGTVDCRQEFAGGLVSESMYRTPYLALPMRLTTEYLYVYCRDKVWHIDLEYVLELEGQTRSRFKLKMEIEEDVKREYEGSTGCCH